MRTARSASGTGHFHLRRCPKCDPDGSGPGSPREHARELVPTALEALLEVGTTSEKIRAAAEILDRGGLPKSSQVETSLRADLALSGRALLEMTARLPSSEPGRARHRGRPAARVAPPPGPPPPRRAGRGPEGDIAGRRGRAPVRRRCDAPRFDETCVEHTLERLQIAHHRHGVGCPRRCLLQAADLNSPTGRTYAVVSAGSSVALAHAQ